MEYDPFTIKTEPSCIRPVENEFTVLQNLVEVIKTETLEIEDYGTIEEENFQEDSLWRENPDGDPLWILPTSPQNEFSEDPLSGSSVLNLSPGNQETYHQSKKKECSTESQKTQFNNTKVDWDLRNTLKTLKTTNNGPEIIFASQSQAVPKLSNKEMSIFASSFVPCRFCLGFFPKSIIDNHLDSCKLRNSSYSPGKGQPKKEALGSGGLFLPCKSCLGFFSNSLLDRHVKLCKSLNPSVSPNSNLRDGNPKVSVPSHTNNLGVKSCGSQNVQLNIENPKIQIIPCAENDFNVKLYDSQNKNSDLKITNTKTHTNPCDTNDFRVKLRGPKISNKIFKETIVQNSLQISDACHKNVQKLLANQNINMTKENSITQNIPCGSNDHSVILSKSKQVKINSKTQAIQCGTNDIHVKLCGSQKSKLNKETPAQNISHDTNLPYKTLNKTKNSNRIIKELTLQNDSKISKPSHSNLLESPKSNEKINTSNKQTTRIITKECFVKLYRDIDDKVSAPKKGDRWKSAVKMSTMETNKSIAKIAECDPLICAFKSQILKDIPNENHKIQAHIRVREVAMLVYKLRMNTSKPSFELKDFLAQEHFSTVLSIVRELAGMGRLRSRKSILPPMIESVRSSLMECTGIVLKHATKASTLWKSTEQFRSMMLTDWSLNLKVNASRRKKSLGAKSTTKAQGKRKLSHRKKLDGCGSEESSCSLTLAGSDTDIEYDLPNKKQQIQRAEVPGNTFMIEEVHPEEVLTSLDEGHIPQGNEESIPQNIEEDSLGLRNEEASQLNQNNLIEKHSSQTKNSPLVPTKKKKKRFWGKKTACIFCDKLVGKYARHIRSVHSYEPEVRRILSKPQGSEERKVLYDKLRKMGNFHHNTKIIRNKTSSNIITARLPPWKQNNSDYLPCKFCLGFYFKSKLYLHWKRCKMRDKNDRSKNCQKEGAVLLASSCEFYGKSVSSDSENDGETEIVLEDENCRTMIERKATNTYGFNRSEVDEVLNGQENQEVESFSAEERIVEEREENKVCKRKTPPTSTAGHESQIIMSSTRRTRKRGREDKSIFENEEPTKHKLYSLDPAFVSKLLELRHNLENEMKTPCQDAEENASVPENSEERNVETTVLGDDFISVDNRVDSINTINETNSSNNSEHPTNTVLAESPDEICINGTSTSNYPEHPINSVLTEIPDTNCINGTSTSNYPEHPINRVLYKNLDKDIINKTSTSNYPKNPINTVLSEILETNMINETCTSGVPEHSINTLSTKITDKYIIDGTFTSNDSVYFTLLTKIQDIDRTSNYPECHIDIVSPAMCSKNVLNKTATSNDPECLNNTLATEILVKNIVNSISISNCSEYPTNSIMTEISNKNIINTTSNINDPERPYDAVLTEDSDQNSTLTSNCPKCPANTTSTESLDENIINPTSSSIVPECPADIALTEISHTNINNETKTPSKHFSGEIVKPNLLKVAKMGNKGSIEKKVKKRLLFCIFCKKSQKAQLALHFTRKHMNEPQVKEFSAHPPNSTERKQLISRLVNQGYFLHNMSVMSEGKGEIMPMRRSRVPVALSELSMCPHCGGSFRIKTIRRHVSKCSKTNATTGTFRNRLLIQELMLSPENTAYSEFWKNVILKMEEDEIADAIRSDFLLMKWGLHLHKTPTKNLTYHSRHCAAVINKLREASCLLLAVRKIKSQVIGFVDLYKPNMYKVVKAAIYSEDVAGYRSGCFRYPTVALHIGRTLTQISKVLKRMCLEEGIEPDMRGIASFMSMMNLNWKDDVNQVAKLSSKVQKIDKLTPKILAENVEKLFINLKKRETHIKEKLQECFALDLFNELSKITLLQIMMLNSDNLGDMGKLRLDKYFTKKPISHSENNPKLDTLGKICNEKWHIVEIVRKSNQSSTIWFSPNAGETIDLLLRLRKEQIQELEGNPYLFAASKRKLGHFYANGILNKYSRIYKTDSLSGLDKKRKDYVSIITTVLSLQREELEGLANMFGVSEGFCPNQVNASDLANISELLYKAMYKYPEVVPETETRPGNCGLVSSTKDFINQDENCTIENQKFIKNPEDNRNLKEKKILNMKKTQGLDLHERNLITACFSEFMLGQTEKMPSVKVIDKFLRIYGEKLNPHNRTRKKIWSTVYYACKGRFEMQRRCERKKNARVKTDGNENSASGSGHHVPPTSHAPCLSAPSETDPTSSPEPLSPC